jgi:hypothetical protein
MCKDNFSVRLIGESKYSKLKRDIEVIEMGSSKYVCEGLC